MLKIQHFFVVPPMNTKQQQQQQQKLIKFNQQIIINKKINKNILKNVLWKHVPLIDRQKNIH